MFSHAYIGPFMTLVRYAHFHVFDRVVCRVRDRVSSRFEAESQKIDSDGGEGGGERRREERNRTYGTVDTVTKRGEATRERTNERTNERSTERVRSTGMFARFVTRNAPIGKLARTRNNRWFSYNGQIVTQSAKNVYGRNRGNRPPREIRRTRGR